MATCIPGQIVDSLKERARNNEITPDDIAKMLPSEQAELKAVLEEFVSEELGVKVSSEEIMEINRLSKDIDAKKAKLNDGVEIGNPEFEQENIDFFVAKKAMDDYLQSRHPDSNLRVATGTIGRGMMLFSVKSPVLNIGSNIEVGFTEAMARRIASGQLQGTDNKLALDYIKMTNKIYQKSGYDISRMYSIHDEETAGGRFLGAYHGAEGPGAVRKVGRFIQDIVFKQLMGAPDVAFSSAHFADSVSLNAMKMAKNDKAQAKTWMQDAMLVEPQTAEGKILRQQAILDAQVATWTDSSWAAKMSSNIRKVLNDLSGDARVGDYVFPFVKTPSNVIATGMDYAGMGIPKALIKLVKAQRTGGIKNMSQQQIQSIARDLVRSGLGIVGALAFAAGLDDDDYVGAYDPARKQIEQLRNSTETSIRIGGKWVSVDWLGPLAVPVIAIMSARKYGDTYPEKIFQYSKGVINQYKQLPGVEGVLDWTRQQTYAKNQSLKEMASEALDTLISEATSRMVPSFISDVARASDRKERVAKGAVEQLKAKVPGLRESLPAKTNIFGQEMQSEPAISTILFGSRVKTDRETETVKFLSDLSLDVGKNIAFTDWDKSSSGQLAQFKNLKGEDVYNEAKIKYGQRLQTLIEAEMAKPKFQKMTPDEQLNVINGLDTKAMDATFKEYKFKYNKKTAPKFEGKQESGGIIKNVLTYAQAIGTDPVTAFSRIFTGQKILRTDNGTIIVARMDLSDSQAVKEKWGATTEMRLDHTVPLQLGGSNTEGNLKLVTVDEWSSYTPVENYLGGLLRDGKITKERSQDLIRRFKNGDLTFEQVKQLVQ